MGGWQERVTVLNDGNVGIGTTSPPSKLTVQGGFYSLGTATELTISGGVVTATQSYHTIDTESDFAGDDLDTINGGTESDILILRAIHDDRLIRLKDGTGNLRLAGDFDLDNTQDRIMLIKQGSDWVEISRSDNS